MLTQQRLFFFGAGSMTEALLKGILTAGILPASQITVSNRQNTDRLDELALRYGVQISQNKEADLANADIVLLAAKPSDLLAGLQIVRTSITERHLLISVAAGITTEAIEAQFLAPIPLIRSMPNTSSAVQASATAISSGRWATAEHVEMARQIFAAIGTVVVVPERELDAVTAIAGSGPAYFYYMVEHLIASGKKLGLAEEMSRDLVLQTIYGAAHMLKETGKDAQTLRHEVTSPNGITMAAIAVLEKAGLPALLQATTERAVERSKEIEHQYSTIEKERLLSSKQ